MFFFLWAQPSAAMKLQWRWHPVCQQAGVQQLKDY